MYVYLHSVFNTYTFKSCFSTCNSKNVMCSLQAEFFIAYVVTTGWTSTSSELFQMMKLILNLIRRNILGREDDQLAVPSAKYYSKIPKILFFGLLGITYLFLAPLILPFLLVYFCLGYIVFRNQVGKLVTSLPCNNLTPQKCLYDQSVS